PSRPHRPVAPSPPRPRALTAPSRIHRYVALPSPPKRAGLDAASRRPFTNRRAQTRRFHERRYAGGSADEAEALELDDDAVCRKVRRELRRVDAHLGVFRFLVRIADAGEALDDPGTRL